jgi:hypothetical protein
MSNFSYNEGLVFEKAVSVNRIISTVLRKKGLVRFPAKIIEWLASSSILSSSAVLFHPHQR